MISEGKCEDWNNGCWKFSFAITRKKKNPITILKYIKIEELV